MFFGHKDKRYFLMTMKMYICILQVIYDNGQVLYQYKTKKSENNRFLKNTYFQQNRQNFAKNWVQR